MPQRTMTKAAGLYTDPNHFSGTPEGALAEADNVVIDRLNVIEPRRGQAQYGNTFGIGTDRSKQLLVYKERVLRHYSDKLEFNENEHNNTEDGSYLPFSGSFLELEPGLRIKGVESNKNFYFTTSDGIKKISARTADDFTTAAGFIIDAGAAKALDLNGTLNFSSEGFLPPNSKVAYRQLWGYKDRNNNVILGTPSARLVLVNYSDVSANVDLQFVIPDSVDSGYFYQIYRSPVFTVDNEANLDLIDPGDDMNLVIEDFPTSAQFTASLVTVTDIAPEDFREGGTPLYTSPNTGDGIDSANEPPPKAKDITLYQSTAFYANTESRAKLTLSLLGVTGMVSGVSSITIDGATSETYTFVGEKETTEFDFSAYVGTIPTDLDGKYFLLNSSSDKRKYYTWFDNTKTTQTLNFSSYVGTIPESLDGRYVVLYTQNDRAYYVWYDSTGSTADPGLDPANTQLVGLLGFRVDISTGVTTTAQLAAATATAIGTLDTFDDFDVNYVALDQFLTLDTESFESTDITPIENIQSGFVYSITTPANADPANTPLVNTDVVGRTAFKVNVSRNISTTAEVAEKLAEALVDQDNASDFLVDYTPASDVVEVTTTNNGKVTDAIDSLINGLGDGFTVTVTAQGDGEDAALKQILLSAAPTVSQQIDETARSLVSVINQNGSETVSAYYLSGPTDIPGQFLLEVKDIGTNDFSVTASDVTVGALFNPPLPPVAGAADVIGEKEVKPNRIYYAKLQQPEAVPILNFIDVGPEDKEISRILALRESLFLLKEDGVYRLTGSNGNYRVDLFDESTKIIAPDTACVLNNQIYCLTNQGITVISDTGAEIITSPIDNLTQLLTSSAYDYRFTSFGVTYETDAAYIVWLPRFETDTVATNAYRYSTKTQTFTRFSTDSKTCGIVNSGDDKLYTGAGDQNFIERERKMFNRKDYADRQFNLSIPGDSVTDETIALSSSQNVTVGDAIVQTQYLTIGQYNQLLAKLDLDPSIGSREITQFDWTSYVGSIPSALHGKYFILYTASDTVKYVVFYDAVGNLPSINTLLFSDARDATQIRVDISSGVTTIADLVNITQNVLKSSTQQFTVAYTFPALLFTTTTIASGTTTNASDSALSGLGNGFIVNVTQQGFGDYLSSLEAVAGDNLKNKVDGLALKLDSDPSVVGTDYFAAVSNYNGSGTASVANPTVITDAAHGLQTGRLVTISGSTTVPNIDGTYVATRLTANTFSIPVQVTTTGNVTWTANVTTFAEIQGAFNTIINKLNVDSGVFFSNYTQSSGTFELETLIVEKIKNSNNVVIEYPLKFIEGPIILYKGIQANLVYTPESFGDPSLMKHVREGTFMFENTNFSRATVGYKTDLSPGIETIDFTMSGKGDWSFFLWSLQNWGGGFSGVPLRTYIPRDKQRCRYIQAQFQHNSAREKWALYGTSYTLTSISEKAYRK